MTTMRTWGLVFLALWFSALCPKPAGAAGNGALEVIMPKRVALSAAVAMHMVYMYTETTSASF